jgi:hypothetical protein
VTSLEILNEYSLIVDEAFTHKEMERNPELINGYDDGI